VPPPQRNPTPESVEGTGSSLRLLRRAQAGETSATNLLFQRQWVALLRWAHGRLPRYARAVADTADIVQDAILQTFRRLSLIEPRGPQTLQVYLRRAVQNRIKDELRRVARRPDVPLLEPDTFADAAAPPDVAFLRAQDAERYKRALATLRPSEQELIVGRFELEYSYQQLALMTGRATADAARVALNRAVLKLAEALGDA
jgi:RNA polymerase sigma factor (sigma-70 family)